MNPPNPLSKGDGIWQAVRWVYDSFRGWVPRGMDRVGAVARAVAGDAGVCPGGDQGGRSGGDADAGGCAGSAGPGWGASGDAGNPAGNCGPTGKHRRWASSGGAQRSGLQAGDFFRPDDGQLLVLPGFQRRRHDLERVRAGREPGVSVHLFGPAV